MSNKYFVFRHSLSVISDDYNYSLEEIFAGVNRFDMQHELLGNHCLFKNDLDENGMKRGYLTIDEDIKTDNIPMTTKMKLIKFPKAEYHFILHKGSYKSIRTTYNLIQKHLEEEDLDATGHPILVFPRGIPINLEQKTTIEIWTPTNADFEAEQRRSDRIKIALPRKRFNFYTW